MRCAPEVEVLDYAFGRLRVGTRTFTRDLILSTDEVIDPAWWRKEGHRLDAADLERAVDAGPRILVVGTGFYGRMQVPDETRAWVARRGIELRALPTAEAVSELVRLQRQCADVVAALHLTC
jgi:hypothetical protein